MAKLTPRQQQVKDALSEHKQAREIAEELGISRNAVYQQIQRLRRIGELDFDFTPTGTPVRERRPQADPRPLQSKALEAGGRALAMELARVRDDLDRISARLSEIVPREVHA